MFRVMLFGLALLALPFVAYAVWVHLTGRAVPGKTIWEGAPIAWLGATGLGLILVGLIGLATFTESEPDQVYVPAHMEDGKIVPGHFAPAPPPAQASDETSETAAPAEN